MSFKANMINRAKGAISTAKIMMHKHGPKVAIVAGVACLIGGTVVACIESQKVPDILDERKEELDEIRSQLDNDEIDEHEAGKQIVRVQGRCLWKFVKLFYKVILLDAGGVLLIAKGVTMFEGAIAGLNTVLMAKIKQQEEMEQRILADLGEEALNKYKYGEPIKITHNVGDKDEYVEDVWVDQPGQYDFIWTSGMGDFSDTSEATNRMVASRILEGFNALLMYSWGVRVNDIYHAFDNHHPKATKANEKACIGIPKVDGTTRIKYILKEVDNTTHPGKTARDLKVTFLTQFVPMGDILEDEGVLARSASRR